MMKITIDKEDLVEKISMMFHDEFVKSLEETDLDDDEKNANLVLSRKRIKQDAENIANIVFNAYTDK